MPSIDGLITGIDTSTIIDGLLSIQKQQIDLLQARRQKVLDQQTAFKGIEARLLSFRTVAARLARTQNSVFEARSVSLSSDGFVAATASHKAALGIYQVRVDALAHAHQVAAQGFADPDSEITQGTLDLRVGTGNVATITVDATNNTLQGLADTINNASTDVTASIVKDGSGGATPYRLLLTSRQSGAENLISITNNLAASSGGAVRPDFDLVNPVQEGTDASVSLGSGPGAITVSSSTNRIDDLITGVTLDLLKADDTQEITLTVAADAEPAQTAVQDFVDGFNDLMSFIDDQVRFEAETGTAGVLLGNRSAIELQDEIRRAVLDVVPGVDSRANRLSAIGISVTDRGRLNIDSARLDDVLSGRVAGVTARDVLRLFALAGESDHPQVQFLLGSSRTKASNPSYDVDVTQAAERASITATSDLADSIVIDGTNNAFSVTVDGAASSTLLLTAGTYSRQSLAELVQDVINADEALVGRSVSVGLEGDRLRITSSAYGATSQVTIGAGTALAALGLAGTENDTGVDVAGTYLVDGESEPAIGRGRLLSGNADNEHTADLQVRVSLTPTQVEAGPEATLTVTRGLAARLDQVLGSLLDPVSGRVKQVDDRFDDNVEDIQASIDRQNARFEAQQQSLIEQFVALESAVNQLQSTSSFLAAQLASLPGFRTTSTRR